MVSIHHKYKLRLGLANHFPDTRGMRKVHAILLDQSLVKFRVRHLASGT